MTNGALKMLVDEEVEYGYPTVESMIKQKNGNTAKKEMQNGLNLMSEFWLITVQMSTKDKIVIKSVNEQKILEKLRKLEIGILINSERDDTVSL